MCTTVTVPHWYRLTVSMDSCNKKMSANGRSCNCIFNIRSTRQFLYTIRRRASCSVCVYMWSTAISCSMLHLYHTPLLQDLLKVRKTVLSRKCNPCQLWVQSMEQLQAGTIKDTEIYDRKRATFASLDYCIESVLWQFLFGNELAWHTHVHNCTIYQVQFKIINIYSKS